MSYGLKLHHMYEAMDVLYAHAGEVEEAVFFEIANLFSFEVDLIFYDTTTASFAIDYEDDRARNPNAMLRCFGRGKEGTWGAPGGGGRPKGDAHAFMRFFSG